MFQNGKHIALVIRALGGRSGGAERIYCELANLLSDSGYRVTCLYFDQKETDPFYHISSAAERINLYGRPRLWVRRRGRLAKILPKRSRYKIEWDLENDFFIRQLSDYFALAKPDVAISVMPPANTPTLLASAGTKVKVVPTNHNVPEQDYQNPQRWSPNPVDRDLRLKALDHAAAIHVLFEEFGKWFPPHLQERIIAIPNYVSPSFQKIQAEKENIILGVGRLAEVKNYLQLIRSWSTIAGEFPEWKVRIYGVGPQLKILKEEIGRLGLNGRVELPGHRSDLAEEYARASIFCHPAHFEGFGLSPAEALFMGTPVVCYADCAGVNQFVRDGYNGIAASRSDGDDLARALRVLITDRALRDRLGSNGPESVSRFTLERYKANWLNLIEKITETA